MAEQHRIDVHSHVVPPYAPPEVSNVFAAHLDEAPFPTDQAAAINRGNALTVFPRLAIKSAVPA
jgi:hypothetical protein